MKNGLQQCSVIPAEPNLGEGGCCGGRGWQVGGEVGCQSVCMCVCVCVCVCVCAHTSTSKQTHKHSRISGQLQLRAEVNCTQHVHRRKHTHGTRPNTYSRLSVPFAYLVSSDHIFIHVFLLSESDTKLLLLTDTYPLILSVTEVPVCC